MIHTTDNFYNKVVEDLDKTYFPDPETRFRLERYSKAKYAVELFNNGCLTYRKLVGRVAKSCQTSTYDIHKLISKHIMSFGSYEYKPSKPEN